MSKRLIELAERRERLVALAATQRSDFSRHLSPLKAGCAVADKGIMGVRYLRQHPALVAGGVGLLVALRPRKAFGWLKRGWFAWRMVQKLRERLGPI
ncbi:MAG: YqjK-like family protein [Sulfuricella denitrificans]|nr:YqjK-like family protein [Sulfuricella denitrificans]